MPLNSCTLNICVILVIGTEWNGFHVSNLSKSLCCCLTVGKPVKCDCCGVFQLKACEYDCCGLFQLKV